VDAIIENSLPAESADNDPSQLSNNRRTVTPVAVKKSRKDVRRLGVIEWLDKLPKVPSHYCRSSSSKQYVDSSLRSYMNMHNIYLQALITSDISAKPVSRQVFVEVMKDQKLDIHAPRKDQCDTCLGFDLKSITKEQYDVHIAKKNEARDIRMWKKHPQVLTGWS